MDIKYLKFKKNLKKYVTLESAYGRRQLYVTCSFLFYPPFFSNKSLLVSKIFIKNPVTNTKKKNTFTKTSET